MASDRMAQRLNACSAAMRHHKANSYGKCKLKTLQFDLGKVCSDVRVGSLGAMVRFMTVRNAARMDGIELHLLLKDLNMVASGTHQQEA
jgi:hypothetical protein